VLPQGSEPEGARNQEPSVEVRPPFLDHRLVEFAASLPENYKLRGSQMKFLLKELMKDKLPPAIVRRRKEGFDIPVHDWFRGVLKSLLLDTLTEQAVKETQIFRWEGVRAVIKRHLDRRKNLGYHLWGLLILFLGSNAGTSRHSQNGRRRASGWSASRRPPELPQRIHRHPGGRRDLPRLHLDKAR